MGIHHPVLSLTLPHIYPPLSPPNPLRPRRRGALYSYDPTAGAVALTLLRYHGRHATGSFMGLRAQFSLRGRNSLPDPKTRGPKAPATIGNRAAANTFRILIISIAFDKVEENRRGKGRMDGKKAPAGKDWVVN